MPEESPSYTNDDGETLLVNLEHVDISDVDVYIGPETEMYDVEQSVLSNPYPVTDVGRVRSQIYYKLHIFDHYLTDISIRKQIHSLKGCVVAGWNYPQHCHGEVLIDLCHEYHTGGIANTFKYIKQEVDDIPTDKLGYHGFELLNDVKSELNRFTKDNISEEE